MNCIVDGCERDQLYRSMCGGHYQRWKTTGDARAADPLRTDPAFNLKRFSLLIDVRDGCWNWQGCVSAAGYGVHQFQGRQWKASRLAYFLTHGSIDDELEVDHLCFNTICVRPDHLELVTPYVNNLRSSSWGGRNSRKTHCPQGHEYSAENTRVTRSGRRECRECSHARWAEQVAKWNARGLARVRQNGRTRLVRCAAIGGA